MYLQTQGMARFWRDSTAMNFFGAAAENIFCFEINIIIENWSAGIELETKNIGTKYWPNIESRTYTTSILANLCQKKKKKKLASTLHSMWLS